MKRTFSLLIPVLLAGGLVLSSCEDKDAPDAKPTIELEAVINAEQEVPRTTSTATGNFTGSYNKSTRVLSYTVTYTGFTPTAGHIHRIADLNSQVGPVEIPFTTLTSPITGTAQLDQRLENELIGGNLYVNLHSQRFPAGEIRGNIRLKRF